MTPTAIRTPLVAIYARVSTDDQRCDLQLNELRGYCERRGWKVYAEYVDTGWSGGKADRPQLTKMMAAARLHKFDVIACWKLDRFGRSVANFVEHLEQLNRWGVRFICITQSIDTDDANPSSRLLMQILAAVSEFEKAMIRERVMAGLAAARKRGVKLGGPRKVFDRDRVVQMHMQGKTYRQIAKAIGISVGTVFNCLPKSA